ncbi:UNVERIFIED_CONTAM: Imidazoleglycerol-phosphate dehydratase 2, chloroplastic [Sesamum indicum]
MDPFNPSSSFFPAWSRRCTSPINLLRPPPVDCANTLAFVSSIAGARVGEAKIITGKTNVYVKINLDGQAVSETNTGIPLLDQMIDAMLQALDDRKGISLYGDFSAPHAEALVQVSLLVEHFFQSLVNTSGMTLHIQQLAGRNSRHIIEATFKAFGRALRQATERDPRHGGGCPRSMH